MELISWICLLLFVWWLLIKAIDLYQTIFPKKLPDWHGKHGEEYIKWKNGKHL